MLHKFLRFLYLNTYGFLCLLLGLIIIGIPLWHISLFWLILQIPLAIFAFVFAYNLLGMWEDKYREYKILIERNKKDFRPETFKLYMDAPCGRKVVKAVLKDLGKSNEYKQLLVYKPTLRESLKDCC